MARNCLSSLCCYGLRARLYIQLKQDFSWKKHHGLLPLHSLLSRHAVNLAQKSFNSTSHTKKGKSEDEDKSDTIDRIKTAAILQNEGFTQVYRLNNAHMFAAVNKVKWRQLYLTLGAVPLSCIGVGMGLISDQAPLAILVIARETFVCFSFLALLTGGAISVLLWTLGLFVTRTVGVILVSPDCKTVCISYITSKGRRQDDVFPSADVIPIDEQAASKMSQGRWVNLDRYSSLEKGLQPYRLFLQMCEVKDETRFKKVFGCP